MLQRLEGALQQAQQIAARIPQYSPGQFSIATCADAPEYFAASVDLENETWDKLSFLDFTAAHHAHYEHLLELFPDFRLCMIEQETGELVATGMCVPVRAEPGRELPQEGWDWIVDTVATQGGRNANVVGALSISVPEQHRQRGFARDMINAMRALAAMRKLSAVIAPVRPSAKCGHPFVSMHEYVTWKDVRGRNFDPWLRSHLAAGGEIHGVCDRSMVVDRPLEFWRSWTGRSLDRDGPVAFDGALAPLEVSLAQDKGRYVEANVWVTHRV